MGTRLKVFIVLIIFVILTVAFSNSYSTVNIDNIAIVVAMGIDLDKIEQISNWVIDRLIWLEEAKIIFEEV